MKYQVLLRNNKEILVEMNEEEYNWIKKGLINGRLKMVELGGEIINTTQILEIRPSEEQLIPKEFRLSEPKFEKADMTEKMKELWNKLKNQGLFREFNSYEQYRESKKY